MSEIFFSEKERSLKTFILIVTDIIMIMSSYWISMWLRLDRETPIYSLLHWSAISFTIPCTLFIFVKIGFYRAILRYVNMSILKWVLIGSFLSTLILIAFSLYQQTFLPRTIPIIYFSFLVILLCGTRFIYRAIRNYKKNKGIPVIIYGAGESGRQLLPILREHKEFNPIAFIDDNTSLHNFNVHGMTVYPSNLISDLVQKNEVKKILLAMPSVSAYKRRRIIENLQHTHCEILTTPNFNELVDGTAQISALKRVSVDDLLGRDQVTPLLDLLSKNILAKNVLVSGAGGSIGSELCRQIIKQKPKTLVLVELTEFALYSIEKELQAIDKEKSLHVNIIPILGDIKNKDKIEKILNKFNINTIYHAAAYKHVPLVELNIIEGIQNNIFGTLSIAEAAISQKIDKFVLISTDKAVRPTNIMGATKRFAELILQALAKQSNHTQFSMVRFGNVLGSSGSVVPLFEKQIANGGPITLTHKDITRYFMTIPEAAQLVIQAGAMGTNGDVFVLDMGESVKIYDLAVKMINLSGLTIKDENSGNGEIEIKVTGLRPGEKLYEELLIGNNVSGTIHPRIMTANELYLEWFELDKLIRLLRSACHERNLETIRKILINAPLEFHPKDNICDLLK
ncbi:polysaccharide biosynthesis protein [Xenorhabdus nematophila]|uniref:polysaccharide biosynthesis protein n=1 Tax=Xenorhabdus nematophila TaxID=628 RepID=UPI0003275BB1|nr:nucleoside-diphosphate sugar epimerase/dehydratase [Xenorhabdus nematophila]CEF30268.1 putative dTDP-glucose-4,6-dehydratase/UDP-glucose 4-epimerase (WeeK) (WbpM) [Xenorhabdus nematophila str. Websteri]AYA41569.1 polysaccharide biosynthesis protein [Xenorhabdus nematophila]MBA0020307.1 polysaccharide biosynthesis protein [Xenorhabdus nematophila]MCB4426090.1 polysaccharide biosynthesis protein [Xenorhabdus nematophila]QNJ35959.1 polysaccharide biosynthesis protein [Xenorhabdus nematophila]